jgi:hypothetical protein
MLTMVVSRAMFVVILMEVFCGCIECAGVEYRCGYEHFRLSAVNDIPLS